MLKGNYLTNSKFKILVTDEEFNEWEPRFAWQMRTRFRKERPMGIAHDDSLGLGLRSGIKDLSLVDNDAVTLVTTNTKRLSRLHWEDILRLQEGDGLLIHFKRHSLLVEDRFSLAPKDARVRQKMMGLGGDVVRLDGSNVVVLCAAIDKAPLHLCAISGTLTLP